MRLAFLGVLLIVLGISLLMSVPFIVSTSFPKQIDVGGLTCIYVFLIPICFSVGMQPLLVMVIAIVMLVIFSIFTYLAYRVFKVAAKSYEGY